ncbi:AraC family transcriptional regulator [Paenibacillus senegalimassiliensis]|uniref:AraC family transcriptional regulator n=1 Tax=Paenibacillus senegalimassiliensis TaxID=1737426 RepID=UPI001E5F97F6|nr:AraC family transcriptional regulator [Paenibacillus senegalimassiliensis]
MKNRENKEGEAMGAIFHYNPDLAFRESPDMYLCFWGKEHCEPLHTFGPGVRDIYKIHFVHAGKGVVRAEGETHVVTAGQAFIAFPEHVIFYQADEHDPWTYSWIGFYGEQVPYLLNRTSLSPSDPVFPMDTKLMPRLYELLNEVEQEEAAVRDLRMQALLNEFFATMVKLAPVTAERGTKPQTKDNYIHRCLDFLHTHYAEDITVAQLATMVGLDRKYLSALFKRTVGLPPQQYLLKYRMERACELLKRGKFTVGEVARSVGYQDALLFSKMFRKTIGVAPSDYRMHT